MGTAVVLGCSTGVGAEVAKALARKGRDIIGFHRGHHNEEARELCKYIHYGTDREIELRTMDVGSSAEDVYRGIEVVNNVVALDDDHVDVVVHSLSGASVGSILTQEEGDIELTFWRLAHSFMDWTRQLAGSAIVAPGCRFLALTNPCPTFYLRNSGVIGPAKAALEAYVRTLAVELGPKGFRVNALSFGAVATPALRKVMPQVIEGWETLHHSIMPSGRMQTCEEIGELVAEITTSKAFTVVNGAILDGTGGSTSTLMDHAFYGTKR
jgi:3-oxoacyl-[acyl-carrier protein] reductase